MRPFGLSTGVEDPRLLVRNHILVRSNFGKKRAKKRRFWSEHFESNFRFRPDWVPGHDEAGSWCSYKKKLWVRISLTDVLFSCLNYYNKQLRVVIYLFVLFTQRPLDTTCSTWWLGLLKIPFPLKFQISDDDLDLYEERDEKNGLVLEKNILPPSLVKCRHLSKQLAQKSSESESHYRYAIFKL